MARSIARAPARSIPSVTSKLCGFIVSGMVLSHHVPGERTLAV